MAVLSTTVGTSLMTALANTSYVISDTFTQPVQNKDLRSVTRARIQYELLNVMHSRAADSIIVSKLDVDIGDIITILLADGSTSDFVVSLDNATTGAVASDLHGTADSAYIDGWTIDVTTSTQGTLAVKVFILPEITFNDTFSIENKTLRYVNSDGVCICDYSCTFTPARTLLNQIRFQLKDNKVKEVYYEVLELEVQLGNAIHTANTSGIKTVSVGGADAPVSTDAYLVYDGDASTNAYSVATGVGGVVDLFHTYDFGNPTIVFEFTMTTGAFAGTPSAYQLLGSNDDTTYNVLLDITQNISIDDLKTSHQISPDVAAAYRYYKVHVTNGNVASSTMAATEYQLLTELVV